MSALTNNTPRIIMYGIKDESAVALVPETPSVAIHSPFMYLLTEKGPDTFFAGPGDLPRTFGGETFNTRGRFYHHQTKLAEIISGEGNSIFVKRLRPTGARTSSKTLCAYLDDHGSGSANVGGFRPYQRVNNAAVANADTGLLERVPTPATPVAGKTIHWAWVDTSYFITGYNDGEAIYNWDRPFNSVANETYIPILTIDADSFGVHGDNTAISLWTAHAKSTNPADPDVIAENSALLFNIRVSKRLNARASGKTQFDLYGESYQEFAFKPNAYNPKAGNAPLGIDKIISSYSDDGARSGGPVTYGPVGRVIFHQENYLTISSQALASIMALDASWDASRDVPGDNVYMVDLFTGIDSRTNEKYHGLQVATDHTRPTQTDLGFGATLVESSLTYLAGGSDGQWDRDIQDWLVSPAVPAAGGNPAQDAVTGIQNLVDKLVIEEMDNVNNPKYPLMDSAQFPFSIVYDSGYGLNTKFALMKWPSLRKGVSMTAVTYTEGQPALSAANEASIGTALVNRSKLYAESAEYGTAPTRFVFVGQSGELIDNSYPRRVSSVMELARKRARYLGSGDGAMKPGLGYDDYPGSAITTMKNLSSSYMSPAAKTAVWGAGVNYAQHHDMKTLQFHSLQTAYPIKNSILTGEINMFIATNLQSVGEQVWRLLVGNSKLSPLEFIQKSNDLVRELTKGKYDGRVTIVPRTYQTPADEARGYSWALEIIMYGQHNRTVGRLNITSRRSSDLVQ